MAIEPKYIVFKREEYDESLRTGIPPTVVEDAVVIRTQDIFAAPALDSYANSISVALMVMGYKQGDPRPELAVVADYFHEKATEAWRREDKKLPD